MIEGTGAVTRGHGRKPNLQPPLRSAHLELSFHVQKLTASGPLQRTLI